MAEPTTVVSIVVSLVLSAASYGISALINRPKRPKNGEQLTEIAERGSYLALAIGRNKVSPKFAYVGNRKVKRSGWTREDGVHLLPAGPGHQLHRIWENGKLIFEPTEPLTREDFPSGSFVDAGDEGGFYIFWGEPDQELYKEASGDDDPLGVNSRWPNTPRIVWIRKRLPNRGQLWGQMEYDWEVRPIPGGITSPNWIDGVGANPANVLYQLLTGAPPHGIGMPTYEVDGGTFNAIGSILHEEGHGIAMTFNEGVTANDAIAKILEETSMMLVERAGRLALILIRENFPDSVEFDGTVLLNDAIEAKQRHTEIAPTRYIFSIRDSLGEYSTKDIPLDSDADARGIGSPRAVKLALETITDRELGQRVADRMKQDRAVDAQAVKLPVIRGARWMAPGQRFQIAGEGVFRVVSVEPEFETPSATINALLDQYGFEGTDYTPPDVTVPGGGSPDPVAVDPAARLIIAPDDVVGDSTLTLAVLRIRAHEQIRGANVYLSGNGTSYLLVDPELSYAAGGTLNADLDATDVDGGVGDILTDGPYISELGADMDDILDLSANDEAWLAGVQLMLINNEWMALRYAVKSTGDNWRLHGLKRGLFGTTIADHAAGSIVYVIDRDAITFRQGGVVASGTTMYAKVQPYTSTQVLPMGDATITSVTT